ncbi:hypothetical protein AGRA3207_006445 [Actinomadura graeca]|uniref:Lipoprotein n=1 Tax=Actinomadura graeca TaxID=2750812 RepID=A0ABX8R7Q4_9ACTN|nr:hypothetical protein [Actinomadura graeca]QXJ25013.1 hypothetical protein AGRA3207_006445 [Actinomadura graeca]
MALLTKTVVLAGAMLALAACGSESAGSGRPCTLVGAVPGVSVDVRPPFAARVASVSLRVCWDRACQSPRVELTRTSKAVSAGCDGEGPDAACGASMSPDGGQGGFARVEGLPRTPVQAFLVLRDGRGRRLLDRRVDLTPRVTFPNGPHCGEGPPQAGLVVADGRVTVR